MITFRKQIENFSYTILLRLTVILHLIYYLFIYTQFHHQKKKKKDVKTYLLLYIRIFTNIDNTYIIMFGSKLLLHLHASRQFDIVMGKTRRIITHIIIIYSKNRIRVCSISLSLLSLSLCLSLSFSLCIYNMNIYIYMCVCVCIITKV